MPMTEATADSIPTAGAKRYFSKSGISFAPVTNLKPLWTYLSGKISFTKFSAKDLSSFFLLS